MVRRIVAIIFIFACITVAWMILGGVTLGRAWDVGSRLEGEVGQLWGVAQQQQAPKIQYATMEKREISTNKNGVVFKEYRTVPVWHAVPLAGSDIKVKLELSHRKRGLIWYSTYKVGFEASYVVSNNTGSEQDMFFQFTLPYGSVFDNFKFLVGAKLIDDLKLSSGMISWPIHLGPKEQRKLSISYDTHGLDDWKYTFGEVSQVKNFNLIMNTDFDKIDFPMSSMSPTDKQKLDKGWILSWKYKNLLSGLQIGMLMPKKLNPGPWVSQLSFFAPVSLFFFFFILFIFTVVQGVRIHPMNYFFVGSGFFAFHLLLAYLVDHVSIHLGFLISSVVSIFLVVTYMRLVSGGRFALLHVGLSQFVYLVLFSYSFFFVGYTGLVVTIMSILTLFVVMQYTGRLDWEQVFKGTSSKQKSKIE